MAVHAGLRLGLTTIALLGSLLFACGTAHAHSSSNAYLLITPAAGGLTLRWDIALRDLELAIGLDQDGDGAITWGELRAREKDVVTYALARLSIEGSRGPCTIGAPELLTSTLSDGAYAVIRAPLACSEGAQPEHLTIGYSALFDIDARHRGLVRFGAAERAATAVMTPEQTIERLTPARKSSWREFAEYTREGVWHIWKGFDHMLFLIVLLLPAVYVLVPGQARGRQRPALGSAAALGPVLLDVFRIVTAFTLAHSITLTLAALDWVSLPARLIESVIAASVILAAANNLTLWVIRGRWILAFAFGLIHGFGFANALRDLGLAEGRFVPALLGFNLGVEAGQLAIVVLIVPAMFALRATRVYRNGLMIGGSLAVMGVASIWFVERVFDLVILDLGMK